MGNEKIMLKQNSVANFAKELQEKGNSLGQDFKDEYKDHRTTLGVNASIQAAFSSESVSREMMNLVSKKESANLIATKEELTLVDEQLRNFFSK